MMPIYAGVAADLMGGALTMSVMPFYMVSVGAEYHQVGISFACFSFGQMFATYWMPWLARAVSPRPVFILGLLGIALGAYVSGTAETPEELMLGRFVAGFFMGNSEVAEEYIKDLFLPAERDSRHQAIGAISAMCFMLMPSVGTLLAHLRYGLVTPFYVAIGVNLYAALFALGGVL